MKYINLGTAITVSKELKTIRSIASRLDTYKKYSSFHRLNNNRKVHTLINGLTKLHKKLTNPTSRYQLPTYKKIRISADKIPNVADLWEKATGIPWLSKLPNTDRLLKIRLSSLKIAKIKARITEQKWRLRQELTEKAHQGYYIIFDTLTIDPKHYKNVWAQSSKIFTEYKNFYKKASNNTHSYFAVREAGELKGRLHIHVIHTMKEMPKKWKIDPNQNKLIPINREIHLAKKAWKYGFSAPIAVRFNTQDAFSRLGWKWPIKKGLSLESSNPSKMANYLGKYLTQTLNHKGTTKWKTKISRGLGMTAVKKIMIQLTTEELETLATLTTGSLITLMKKPIPKGILIKEATREYLLRLNKFSLKKRLKLLTEITPQPSIIEQWNLLTMRKTIFNSRNTINITTRIIKNTESSNIKKIIEKLEKQTRCIYNPEIVPYVNHITPSHRNPLNL